MNKLVVVGTGHVGSQVVTACSHLNLFSTIVTIDENQVVAAGEALDHSHALPALYRSNTTFKAGHYADCSDADIIVIAVAVNEALTEDGKMPARSAWGKENAREVRRVMAGITTYTKDAIIVVITNPVDAITYIAETEFQYPKGKIFGTGTTLDSFRLRQLIGNHYGVDSKLVSGFIIGEHGTTAFPLQSTIRIAGINYQQADTVLPVQKDKPCLEDLTQQVVTAANDVFEWKGWTNVAIAEVTAAIVRAILLDEKHIFPVTAAIDGLYGYHGDVAFATPSVIGKNGLEKQLELPLTKVERLLLDRSVQDIQAAIHSYQ